MAHESISYEDKTNEMPVFQSMLDYLDVTDKTITADAMRCQKETGEKIIIKHGDYVFGLKGNQGRPYEDVALYFVDSINNENVKTFKSIEKKRWPF